jgi:hypothetical protein
MKRIILLLVLGALPTWGDWSTPVNLGPGVNTNLHDFAPSLSVSVDTLYFMRLESNNEDYNIYISVFRGGVWDSAVSVGDSINNSPGNFEGAPFISYDGSRLYFTRAPQSTHYPFNIYYSERRNGVWQGPIRFEAPWNNDSSNASWPCFAHDGRRIYFYSYNRPGGRGNGDLWYSDYDSLSRVWGPPVNMGDSINTSEFELCPTLSWDDQTLYFASNIPPSQPPQIYRSQMVNGVWQKRVRLPGIPNYPIGTSNYPCLSADGQHLFFGGGNIPLPSYGLHDIYDSQWVVGVEEPLSGGSREGMRHSLLFPNPLRRAGQIHLGPSPESKNEKLHLYDLCGRRVRTWGGDLIRKGNLTWDGKGEHGRPLASGIYFFGLASGGEELFFKVIFLP